MRDKNNGVRPRTEWGEEVKDRVSRILEQGPLKGGAALCSNFEEKRSQKTS